MHEQTALLEQTLLGRTGLFGQTLLERMLLLRQILHGQTGLIGQAVLGLTCLLNSTLLGRTGILEQKITWTSVSFYRSSEITIETYFCIRHKNMRKYSHHFELLFSMINLHFGKSN